MKKIDTVIISGGLATRFKKIQSIPKILTKFNNKIVLNIIIKNLERFGLNKIHFLCGKNTKIISKFTKSNKQYFFYEEEKLLGTAGCLSNLNKKKLSNDILIIFGDLLFDIDFSRFFKFHKKKRSDVTVFSHPSDHLYDSDILDVNSNGAIKKIFFKPHKKKIISNNLTMAGIFIIKKKVLNEISKNKKNDFSRYFLRKLIRQNKKIISYNSREYCKDFGTPNRYKIVKDFKNNIYKYKSIRNKIPAVFLDRDGVINKDMGPTNIQIHFLFKNSIRSLVKREKVNI